VTRRGVHFFQPPFGSAVVADRLGGVRGDDDTLGVALQVEFERQILKPVFHLIGFRLWV
jgi:hypothetical protein